MDYAILCREPDQTCRNTIRIFYELFDIILEL